MLWSQRSVMSRWVRAEATLAERKKTLMPAMIEPCERPIMFELTQTADLSHWQGDTSDKAWRDFARHVSEFVGKEAVAPASARREEPLPRLDALSIVVLPFANMSGDPVQDYFADGISEDIITDLSKVSALGVISRNTAFSFKGKSLDVRQVASQLNVTHVLEGSVRKAGNRVRITAQLIEGSSDNHIWAERWDRDLDDIFALQDEISQEIVKALKLKLLPEEKKAIADRGTSNLEAFDLYLRARSLARTFSPIEIRRAIEVYRQSLARDPNFAQAWAGLANALARALLSAPETQAETRKAMDEAINRALALAPNSWITQLSQATQLFARHEWEKAEHAYFKAIELAPASEPSVQTQYGEFLGHIGRTGEAIERLKTALRTEPLSLEVSQLLQLALGNERRHDEAAAEYERSKDLAGDHAISEAWAVYRQWELGTVTQIKQQLVRYLSFENVIVPVLQELGDVLDRPAAVLALLRRAQQDSAYQDPTRQIILGSWAGQFGDVDLTLAATRRSLVDMMGTFLLTLWTPALKEVRKDPRFKDIVHDLGLVDYYRTSGKWPDCLRPLGDDDFEVIG